MITKREDKEVLVLQAVHKFSRKTKQYMKIAESSSNVKAYRLLLRRLDCNPPKLAEKLRNRVWRGKNPSGVLAAAQKN